MRLGGDGKILAQPLRTWLTDVQRSTNGAYRGNSVGH
jgi:hypothetical protein